MNVLLLTLMSIYIDGIATLIRIALFVLQKQKLTTVVVYQKTLPCFLSFLSPLLPLLLFIPSPFFIDCQRLINRVTVSQRILLGTCLHIDGCMRQRKSAQWISIDSYGIIIWHCYFCLCLLFESMSKPRVIFSVQSNAILHMSNKI